MINCLQQTYSKDSLMWASTKQLTTSNVAGPFWLKFLVVLVDMGGKCHVCND